MSRILVCDDDKEIVEAITIYLQREGYETVHAYDGTQAIAILEQEAVDLLIVDMMMPGLSGVETIFRIRENNNLPIIILSAKSEDQDKIFGLKVGADDYLTKPFQMLELAARVEAVLRRTRKVEAEFVLGALKCDFDRHQVFLNGTAVECTPKE
nr:response regulator transcription factor [Lachnospiraceae bacterium]